MINKLRNKFKPQPTPKTHHVSCLLNGKLYYSKYLTEQQFLRLINSEPNKDEIIKNNIRALTFSFNGYSPTAEAACKCKMLHIESIK